MKIIVIGLGSMGKRRIRLLSEHKDMTLFGIDNNQECTSPLNNWTKL